MIVLFVEYFFARLHGSPLSETCKMFELRRWPSHASMPLLGNFARHFTSFIFDLFWPHNVDDLCLLDWIQSKLVGGSFSTSKWYISQRRCSSPKRSRWTQSRRWGASKEERSTWGRPASTRRERSQSWGRRRWSAITSKVCSKSRGQRRHRASSSIQTTRREPSCCKWEELNFFALLVRSILSPESFLRSTLEATTLSELGSPDLLIERQLQRQIVSQTQKLWTSNKQSSSLREMEWTSAKTKCFSKRRKRIVKEGPFARCKEDTPEF